MNTHANRIPRAFHKARTALCAQLLMCACALHATAADAPTARSIEPLSGNLYRYVYGAHVAMFMITDEGALVTDPINETAARWLKDEIRGRFGQQVRYVVYSHSDADHISGGQVYADTAAIVAHENADPIIAAGDYTARPTILFREHMELTLGGERVVLRYLGPSHTDNVIVIEFPAQRTVHIVDSVTVDRLPYRTMNRYFLPEAIEFLERVEELDFDVVVPGHGQPGDKTDVSEHREYFEALYLAVRRAKRRGLSLAEAQATIRLEEFRDMGRYDEWLGENIAGVYRILDEGGANGN